jgi:hypothetical protein
MRKLPLNVLDIDLRGGLTSEVTPHAGIALAIETAWRIGVIAAAGKHLLKKRSPRGLARDQMVEAFVLLSAWGGDGLDDVDGLRRDMGLRALTGHSPPGAGDRAAVAGPLSRGRTACGVPGAGQLPPLRGRTGRRG